MKRLYLIVLSILMSTMAFAQQEVNGTVTDREGEPIPGASVILNGTNKGTFSNSQGKFSLTVPDENAVLTVSFPNYISKEVALNGRKNVEILLESGVKLDEVVIVGYGSERKSDVTGAVSTVKVEENVARQSTTVDQLLQGRAAGVQVTGGGQPGAGISVRIRGTNSLRGNNEPLYVVDGVIISSAGEDALNASPAGSGNSQENQNGLNGINPRDIESIEVLKDASATAIYGSRGANGVVLITTKKGESGRARINAYVNTSMTSVSKKIDVLNGRDFAQYRNELSLINGENSLFHIVGDEVYQINGLEIGEEPLTQHFWQDEIYEIAEDLNAGLTFSGGTEKSTYYISGGFNHQGGLVEGSQLQSGDLRINLNSQLSNRLKVDARFNAFYSEGTLAQDGDRVGNANRTFVSTLLFFSPIVTGNEVEEFAADNNFSSPYAWLNDFEDVSREARYFGRLGLTYQFPIKGLSYELNAGGNIRNKERKRWYGLGTFQGSSTNGALSISQLTSQSYQVNNLLRYSKYGKVHRINAVAGFTIDGRNVENELYAVENFATTSFTVDQPFFGQTVSRPLEVIYQPVQILSLLGRVNYTLKNRYILTGTFRYDGVSKFQGDNRWGLFPSFAVAWRASQEPFIERLKVFDELKFRAGWGQIGNHGIQAFQTLANYGGTLYATPSDGTGVAFIPLNIPNPALQWETTEQLNVGVDFGFFKNRLTGTVDYYNKNTTDLLQQLVLPPSAGFGSLTSNRGEVTNEGIELLLNMKLLSKKDFQFSLGGNIAFNRTQITSLGIPNSAVYINGVEEQRSFYLGQNVSTGLYFKSPANIFMEGEPIGLFFGYETNGIYQSSDEILVAGAQPGDIKIVDQNGDGIINTLDRTIIGDPNPDFVYGINLSIAYKGLSLNVLVNGVYGNEIANGNSIRLSTPDQPFSNILPETFHGAWRPDRETNDYPRIGYLGENNASAITDRIIEDGSFMRLGNVTLGYDIPLPTAWFIRSINVYLAGRNLITLTDYSGYDPELRTFLSNGNIIGVDWAGVPNIRSVTFGANLNF